MHESILFKGVEIVTPGGRRFGDLFVENGKISAMDGNLNKNADLVIKDSGLTLMPGVIDPHVHFREPGAEWKEDLESGSKAAVSGGVTSFFEMPNTKPSATTAKLIQAKKDIASQKSLANYNFFIGATPDNLDELNNTENIPGIKIFVGSSTGSLLVEKDDELKRIFENGDRLIAVHSEDETTIKNNRDAIENSQDVKDHYKIRNVEAAMIATKRLVKLSKEYDRRLHICHLTTEEETQFLSKEKYGSKITTEVSPQHLLLYGPDIYDEIDTFAQINPPIREKRHSEGLWRGLKHGTIDFVATDHAPHTIEEKQKGYPNAPSGMPGVETSLSLMLTLASQNKCSLEDVVRWMCEAPAACYKIHNKGKIQIGYDADLVLVDLNAEKTIENGKLVSKCNWSAFNGWTVKGLPIMTFVNGQIAYREGDFFAENKGKEVRIR